MCVVDSGMTLVYRAMHAKMRRSFKNEASVLILDCIKRLKSYCRAGRKDYILNSTTINAGSGYEGN
eukprot:1835356-Amphidinium_carterae.1